MEDLNIYTRIDFKNFINRFFWKLTLRSPGYKYRFKLPYQ